LRRQLDDRDRQLGDLRADRDHWRAQAEATQRLLADMTALQPPEPEPKPPLTWWRWLRTTG
jgi:hypothetical protein